MAFIGPVEDRLAIRELIESYADAVFRVDADAWAALWAEDGVWTLMGMEHQGRERIAGFWRQAMSNFSFTGFFGSPAEIRVEGERATGRCYITEVLREKSTGNLHRNTGKYDDVYVKRNGRWLFARRDHQLLLNEVQPAKSVPHTIVIAGFLDLDPARRDDALREAEPYIKGALSQAGCVYYAWTADVLTPGRIYVFEEWTSQDALAAHLAGPHYQAMAGHLQKCELKNAVTKKYRVNLSEPVYDPTGKPRADFFTAKD